MATNVHLTPELEQRKHRFQLMLHEVEREVDREGTCSVDSVLAEVDRIIEAVER